MQVLNSISGPYREISRITSQIQKADNKNEHFWLSNVFHLERVSSENLRFK